jgi:hypothetical protein
MVEEGGPVDIDAVVVRLRGENLRSRPQQGLALATGSTTHPHVRRHLPHRLGVGLGDTLATAQVMQQPRRAEVANLW